MTKQSQKAAQEINKLHNLTDEYDAEVAAIIDKHQNNLIEVLRRTTNTLERVLVGKPVRDADEVLSAAKNELEDSHV